MKSLIFLLGISMALPGARPEAGAQPAGGGSSGSTAADHSAISATSDTASATATALVVFGSDTVRAEVANTAALRSRGLMYREELPDGTGMLFVFDREAEHSFWMQNTYVALDVAFIDSSFRIVDIQQMEPESRDIHDSASPAMFALEVRQGWFAEKGITVGDVCQLIFPQ
jgi:uncharacterized membrane protein (UPF0127 family)